MACRGRKKGRKKDAPLPPPSLPPPSLLFHPKCFCICVSLCWRRVSPRKGELTAPLKAASPHCWGGKKKKEKKVCGGKHSPPAEIFGFFGISMRNCARGVTRNVRIGGSGAEGIWLNAAAQRARSPGSWRLRRLAPSSTYRQVSWSFVSSYFIFGRCCVLIMKATHAVDRMRSR